ncbi:MAG: hydrogenase maturation protease [Candidatus Micrarchaeota archaeon]
MDFLERLKQLVKDKKVLALGVGNSIKSDDGIGEYILKRLKTKNKIFCGSVPENFIFKIKENEPDLVLIIDAMDFQGKPGEVLLASAIDTRAPKISTHSLSFDMFDKFLPGVDLHVLGIQAKNLDYGDEISKEVLDSADHLVLELNKVLL